MSPFFDKEIGKILFFLFELNLLFKKKNWPNFDTKKMRKKYPVSLVFTEVKLYTPLSNPKIFKPPE